MHARAILATLGVLLLAGTVSAEPVGFVAAARGMAELRTAGTRTFTLAAIDRDVSEGDAVRTGRDGWVKLLLRDDTTLAVDEETELVLDRYVLGKLSNQQPSRIQLLSGRVRTKVAEVFGGETRLEIRTPTAVIGVKGTEWITWLHNGDTFVCVIRGLVSAASSSAAVGGAIEVAAEQCARIGRDEPPQRVVQPAHMETVAMRPGQVPDRGLFPAKPQLDGGDPLVIEVNDTRPEIRIPEPNPPPRTVVPDPPPAPGPNGFSAVP